MVEVNAGMLRRDSVVDELVILVLTGQRDIIRSFTTNGGALRRDDEFLIWKKRKRREKRERREGERDRERERGERRG